MTVSKLSIDITDVPLGLEQKAELEFTPVPDFPLDFKITDVKAEFVYIVERNSISLSGSLDAHIAGVCARCLGEAKMRETVEFSEGIPIYREAVERNADAEYYSDGRTLELEKLFLDAILLSAPNRLLCSKECKGLCPKCGTNLNISTCSCKDEPDEFNPFSSLKDLFKD